METKLASIELKLRLIESLLEKIAKESLNYSVIIRLPEVKARTGLSRSTIYEQIRDGKFPKQVSLGSRATGWRESEVNQWVASREEPSD